jgi:rhodanese-related sulfurtransferase
MFRIFDRKKPFIDLHSADFEREITNSSNAVILDVSTPGEYNFGKIPGAINIDITRGDFESLVDDTFDKEKIYFVYCRAGNRSVAACNILGSKGFRSYNLVGGILKWKGAIQGSV